MLRLGTPTSNNHDKVRPDTRQLHAIIIQSIYHLSIVGRGEVRVCIPQSAASNLGEIPPQMRAPNPLF